MIASEQLRTYKTLTGDDEKYMYYFTNNAEGNDINDINEKSIFYQSYLELEKKLIEEIKSKNYHTLILLVGFSIQPLVLSISVLKPKKVYLLFSKETKENCSKIMKWVDKFTQFINLEGESIEFVGKDSWVDPKCQYLVDSSDPSDTYNKILNIINNEKTNGPIAIDITGGKKTMVSGAFTAAAITDTDALYVDFSDYDGANPIPGTEFIQLQTNPLDVFLKNVQAALNSLPIYKEHLTGKLKDFGDLLISIGILKEINVAGKPQIDKPHNTQI